jgi:hypothetical protein
MLFLRWSFMLKDSTNLFIFTTSEDYQNNSGTFLGRMLYDHKVDPNENINISDKPENYKLVAKMKRLMKKGWKAVTPLD